MKLKAVLDVDEVALAWTEAFDAWIREYKMYDGAAIHESTQTFDELDLWDWVKEFNHSKEFAHIPFVEGALEGIRELYVNGFDIEFLSSCGRAVCGTRYENLLPLNIPFELHCLDLHELKEKYLATMKPDLFIDDNIHNVRAAANYGLSLHMQTNFNEPAEIMTVESWTEIMKIAREKFSFSSVVA